MVSSCSTATRYVTRHNCCDIAITLMTGGRDCNGLFATVIPVSLRIPHSTVLHLAWTP
jgi:hypothetical protein